MNLDRSFSVDVITLESTATGTVNCMASGPFFDHIRGGKIEAMAQIHHGNKSTPQIRLNEIKGFYIIDKNRACNYVVQTAKC